MKELRTYRVDDDLEKYGRHIDENLDMDQKFYESVMDEVDLHKSDAFLALDIYRFFSQKVSYDELFALFEQDQSLDFIRDIYQKSLEDITEEENSVICTTWATAFAYFLNKNGIDAVVNQEVNHAQVFFKADQHIFRADATGKLIGYGEKNQMSDLTRCKLGILPQGFLIYEENEQGLMEEKNFFDSSFYKSSAYQENKIDDYTMNILEELKQDEDFYSYEIPEDFSNTFSQIAMISAMLSMGKLDTVGGITYLKHLMKVLIPEDERKKITLDHIKLIDEEVEVLDVHSINYGVILTYTPEEVEEPKCCFFHPSVSGYNFLYSKHSSLLPISEEEAYHLQERNDDIELEVEEHHYKRGGK